MKRMICTWLKSRDNNETERSLLKVYLNVSLFEVDLLRNKLAGIAAVP